MVMYPEKIPHPPITFGGLDADAGALYMQGNKSPDLRNIEFDRIGSISKRGGIAYLNSAVAGSQPPALETDDTIAFIAGQNVAGDSPYQSVICYKGRVMGWSVSTGAPDDIGATWYRMPSTFTASGINGSWKQFSFTNEGNDPAAPTSFVFRNDAIYCVSKDAEPWILGGSTGNVNNTVAVADFDKDGSNNVFVTFGSSLYMDGDVIMPDLTGHSGTDPEYYAALHNKCFHMVPKNSTTPGTGNRVTDTEFFLKYWNGSSYVNLTVAGAISAVVPTNEARLCRQVLHNTTTGDETPIGRWPRGVYSLTAGIACRGYPQRWDDYANTGASDDWEFPRGTPDWPSGFEIIGESLEARGFAWGFKHDPQRIDYSELGAPYNFLKNDVVAADEASADDLPGVDGGYFYADRGDGDPVVAVRAYQDYIAVFKNRKTMLYKGIPGDTFDTTASYSTDPLQLIKTINLGAVSENSIISVGNDLYFWSEEGPQRLSAVNEYGDLMAFSISRGVRKLLSSLNLDEIDACVSLHNKIKGYIAWYVPTAANTTNKIAVVYFYETGDWSIYDGRGARVSHVVRVSAPMSAEDFFVGAINDDIECSDGTYQLLFRLDSDTHDAQEYASGSYADVEIEAYYYTRWYDAGDVSKAKRDMGADVVVGENGFNGSVKFLKDFSTSETTMSALETIGTTTSGRGIIRAETGQPMRAFSYKIIDNTAGDFSISGIIPDLRERGDRA